MGIGALDDLWDKAAARHKVVMANQEKFEKALPELKECTGYGAATSFIRKHIDKNFNKVKADEELKTYRVVVTCWSRIQENGVYTIEAPDEEAACDEAAELAEDEFGEYDDIDFNVKEQQK